jgi:hypothetical protein
MSRYGTGINGAALGRWSTSEVDEGETWGAVKTVRNDIALPYASREVGGIEVAWLERQMFIVGGGSWELLTNCRNVLTMSQHHKITWPFKMTAHNIFVE